jgi:trimeric autotransporter adhesin
VILGSGLPNIGSVVNAASLQPGISPGQLVTIRGTHLSTPPLTGEPDSGGQFPILLGNSRVTFNGTAAPILYVSNNQINCVTPNSLKDSRTAEVIVERPYPGGTIIRSQLVTVQVQDTFPGIFTSDANGSGVAAGVNDESNPAPKGSVITFYATGAGSWEIPYPDGALALSEINPPDNKLLIPAAPVSVTIGGQPAKIIQASRMAKQVSGMLVVQVQVPEGIGSGAQPITLTIGGRDNSPPKSDCLGEVGQDLGSA